MDFGAHSWIWTILVGLVIGAIAKLLMPGRDPGGCIITILLGIAGAFVGTWIGRSSRARITSLAGSCRSSAPWFCCCCIDSFLNAARSKERGHSARCRGMLPADLFCPVSSESESRSCRQHADRAGNMPALPERFNSRVCSARRTRHCHFSWPRRKDRSLSSRLPRCT